MQLKIIKNEKEYDEALNRIDELMELNPELGTKESDELECNKQKNINRILRKTSTS